MILRTDNADTIYHVRQGIGNVMSEDCWKSDCEEMHHLQILFKFRFPREELKFEQFTARRHAVKDSDLIKGDGQRILCEETVILIFHDPFFNRCMVFKKS